MFVRIENINPTNCHQLVLCSITIYPSYVRVFFVDSNTVCLQMKNKKNDDCHFLMNVIKLKFLLVLTASHTFNKSSVGDTNASNESSEMSINIAYSSSPITSEGVPNSSTTVGDPFRFLPHLTNAAAFEKLVKDYFSLVAIVAKTLPCRDLFLATICKIVGSLDMKKFMRY